MVEAWNIAVTFVTQTIPQRAGAFVQSIFPAFQDEKVRQTGKAVGAIIGTGALLYGGYKVGLDIYCDYVLSKSTSWTPSLMMFVFPLSAVVMSGEKRLRSGLLSLLIMGILLTGCTGGTSTTPAPGQTSTLTETFCTNTPTQMPAPTEEQTLTATASMLSSDIPTLWMLANYIDSDTSQYCQEQVSNLDTIECQELLQKVKDAQDQYDTIIWNVAHDPNNLWTTGIDPTLLSVVYKRVVINETQFVPGWVTGTELGTGLAQVTPDTLRLLSNFGYIQIPSNVNKNENASLLALLQNPTFNANAGMANLVYIYNGITQKNKIHDWQMSDDDIWKFVAALYNAGPHDLPQEYVPIVMLDLEH